ncbi:MAG: Nucleoporin 62kDa-like protein [Tardiphaga sp.]|jgi:hypothetical protein|nr:Nucleoporin 62kDa-like protein [Tardiphaga sp.]
MRNKALIVVVSAAMVLGGLAAAGPAQAATTGGTPVTIQVTGGALNISVPAGPVSLGSVSASSSAQTVSASLGTVSVTDGRGGTAGWVATASGVAFTGPQTISVSATGLSSYTATTASVVGTAVVADTDLDALSPGGVVQTATGVVGINSATWSPTISVTVPANALAGTYSSTITHSVS